MRRYEDRPSQRAMAAEIARLYNDGGVGLLEAGTGVGKSMGYLVPALRWAAANGGATARERRREAVDPHAAVEARISAHVRSSIAALEGVELDPDGLAGLSGMAHLVAWRDR